jgi:peroxiredoxin
MRRCNYNKNKDAQQSLMSTSPFLDKLAHLRATNCENLPTPEFAILTRTVARLRREEFSLRCLQLGETAPDFEFIDASNTPQSFYKLLQQGPVVLNFFRGFWCQYCKTEIEAYENIQLELERLGCSYFAVSPQKPDTASYQPSNYQVLYDRDNKIAQQFGIVYSLDQAERELFQSWGLDLDQVNGNLLWELPIPATFIVCEDRRIGYEYVDVDFRARCCPDQLIEELKSFCNSQST